MRDGKWITDLDATTPLADAARRVLTVRLEIVHDRLPLALHRWTEDAEHIHQLRVGTRRGGAALAIFSQCLPRQVFKKARKHLRRLRRAAGAARDWDVFSQALTEREGQTTPAQKPGLDFLLGYSNSQRMAAQEALVQTGARAPFDLEEQIAETVAAVQAFQHPPHALGDLAGPWLAEVSAAFHGAATENLEQYEHLHRVRILGKRLRYGMEIFACCFKDEFKTTYYPLVEEMQDILGLANDSKVAAERLTGLREVLRAAQPILWKRFRPGIENLLKYHQRRLPQQRRNFIRWLSRWEKSGALAALTK